MFLEYLVAKLLNTDTEFLVFAYTLFFIYIHYSTAHLGKEGVPFYHMKNVRHPILSTHATFG